MFPPKPGVSILDFPVPSNTKSIYLIAALNGKRIDHPSLISCTVAPDGTLTVVDNVIDNEAARCGWMTGKPETAWARKHIPYRRPYLSLDHRKQSGAVREYAIERRPLAENIEPTESGTR
jgi:hypothetical protein